MKLDQLDILAQLDSERAEHTATKARIVTLEDELKNATATASRAPNLEANLSTVTADRDSLKAKLEVANGLEDDINKRVAAELAKHGILANGVESPKADDSKPNTGGNLVEQYNALTDLGQKAVFIAKHGKALREILRG